MKASQKLWLVAGVLYALLAIAAGLVWAYQIKDDAHSAQTFERVVDLVQPLQETGQLEEPRTQTAHDKYMAH